MAPRIPYTHLFYSFQGLPFLHNCIPSEWFPVITRHVMEQWIDDDDWERTEMPVPELASEDSIGLKGNDRATMNPPENKAPEINSKKTENKNKRVKP